jgi:hypothetical protein
MKITVERWDEFCVALPQIFDRVKSVALWSAKKKKDHKGYCSAAIHKPEILKNINYSIEHKHFVDTAIVESLKGGLVKELSNTPHVVIPLTVSINGKGKYC